MQEVEVFLPALQIIEPTTPEINSSQGETAPPSWGSILVRQILLCKAPWRGLAWRGLEATRNRRAGLPPGGGVGGQSLGKGGPAYNSTAQACGTGSLRSQRCPLWKPSPSKFVREKTPPASQRGDTKGMLLLPPTAAQHKEACLSTNDPINQHNSLSKRVWMN